MLRIRDGAVRNAALEKAIDQLRAAAQQPRRQTPEERFDEQCDAELELETATAARAADTPRVFGTPRVVRA